MLKRKPFVFELRDLWPASIHAVGAVRSSWPLRLIERLELFLYRKAARVVAVTRAYRDNLIARGIPAGKIDVVTNGVDLERYHPEPADSAELRQSLGLEGQFVAGYIGTLGMAHHLETVLRAAQRIQELDRENPDVQGQRPLTILLVGDGARREELIAQSVELGLTNLRFIDAVPKDAVVAYWGLLDAGIIHVASNPVFESVIPSKLFECMAMGVPVLHGLRGESADLVRETGCGEVFEPDNVDQLVELLQLWRQSDTDLRYYSEAGVRTAQRFDRALLADRMLRILECCAKQPPRLGLAAQAKASEASEQHATHTPRH